MELRQRLTSLTVAPPCARSLCCFLVISEGLRQRGAASPSAAADGSGGGGRPRKVASSSWSWRACEG